MWDFFCDCKAAVLSVVARPLTNSKEDYQNTPALSACCNFDNTLLRKSNIKSDEGLNKMSCMRETYVFVRGS